MKAAHDTRARLAERFPERSHIVIDQVNRRVEVNGERMPLTGKGYELFSLLAERPGRVTPYPVIYAALWGGRIIEDNQVHCQKRRLVERLRRGWAIEVAESIVCVRGRGFMLDFHGQIEFKRRPASA